MISIVIADDHKLFAQGLANILAEDPEFQIKAVFNDGRSMVDYLCNQDADIAIVDLNMPNFDGKSTLLKLKEHHITSKKIVVSMYAEESLLKECAEIGIDAYLLKDTEPQVLKNTIKDVYHNKHVFCVEKVNLMDAINLFKDDFINKYKLSKRELEVIHFVVEGLTNAKIGDKLFLSTYTIDTHRKNISQKLGISNTAELVKIAMEQGIN
ncbi:MAG: response regulator transcription factor [Pelobium sp.]